MNHFLASDNRYRDLIRDDGRWSDRLNKRNSPGDYRFGMAPGKHVWVHALAAFNRVGSYLKSTIEVIANSKLRRMERELELGGIRRDWLNGSPAAPRSRPPSFREG
jgi:hypothetical protein